MKQIRYRSRRRKRSTKLSGYKHYSFLLRALLFTLIAIAFTVNIYQHSSSILGNRNNEYTDFEINKVGLLRKDNNDNKNNNNINNNNNYNNNTIRNTTTKNRNRHDKEEDNGDDDDINKTTSSSDTTTNIEEKKKTKKKDDDDDAERIEDEHEDDDEVDNKNDNYDTAGKTEEEKTLKAARERTKAEKKAKMEADKRLAREEAESIHNINYRLVQERTTTTTRTTTRTTTTDTTDNDNNNQQLPLQFIPNSNLGMLDYFSATWFLSRERFLEINYNDISICEDAVFVCVKRKRKNKNKNYTKQSEYIHNSIRSTAKMTLDWTHFNVEHLSKYWTTMSLMTRTKPRQPQDMIVPLLTSMLDTVIQKRMSIKTMTPIKKKERKILVEPSSSSLSLSSFSSEQVKQQQQLFQQQQQQQPPLLVRRSTELEQTIAIIPFMPVIKKITLLKNILSAEGKGGGQQMSAYSLAATLSSLWSIGVGRVVVVSLSATDSLLYIREACQLLQKTIATMLATDDDRNQIIVKVNNNNNTDNNNEIATIGYSILNNNNIHHNQNQNHHDLDRTMEIAHVHVTDPFFYQTKHVAKNVPRAAVAGLWTALSGTHFNSTRTQEYNEQERSNWLGTTTRNNDWKYVYLTEPDTILNMNMDLVSSFKDALDQGTSLFPHRIHPLPHELNLSPHIISKVNKGLYLPNAPPFHVTKLVYPQSDRSAAQSVIESQSTQSQTQVHNNTDTDSSSNVRSSSDSAANYIACCDAGRWWPGSFCWKKEKEISNPTERHYCQERWVRDKTKCASYIGAYWWSCGFKHIDTRKNYTTNDTKNTKNTNSSSSSSSSKPTELERRIIERHHNLLEYQYMTIQDGTGAVFGSSNHGRTCLPSKVPCTN